MKKLLFGLIILALLVVAGLSYLGLFPVLSGFFVKQVDLGIKADTALVTAFETKYGVTNGTGKIDQIGVNDTHGTGTGTPVAPFRSPRPICTSHQLCQASRLTLRMDSRRLVQRKCGLGKPLATIPTWGKSDELPGSESLCGDLRIEHICCGGQRIRAHDVHSAHLHASRRCGFRIHGDRGGDLQHGPRSRTHGSRRLDDGRLPLAHRAWRVHGCEYGCGPLGGSATSLAMQYAGLGTYVVAEAIIFVPILLIAQSSWVGAGREHYRHGGSDDGRRVRRIDSLVFADPRRISPARSCCLGLAAFAALGFIVCSVLFGFNLGNLFAGVMVAFAAAYILYYTSNVLHEYGWISMWPLHWRCSPPSPCCSGISFSYL